MRGVACPNCGKPALPFRRYWREVENRRTIYCAHCSAKLRPSALFALSLLPGSMCSVGLFLPTLIVGESTPVVVVAAMSSVAAGSFASSICAWLLIPWVSVARESGLSDV